jgi:hypothetical protein
MQYVQSPAPGTKIDFKLRTWKSQTWLIASSDINNRDRCYDLKNIFAKKFGEKMAFFLEIFGPKF